MPKTIWHSSTIEEVLGDVKSAKTGLTISEVKKRLHHFGYNELPKEKGLTKLTILLEQFKSSLIYVLLSAVFITLLMSHFIDAGVIFASVVLNVIVGFFQENRAYNALEKLRQVVSYRAEVKREDHEMEIAVEEIVPGDILVLRPGEKVPADARLISAKDLQINEASLTGESYPESKQNKKLVGKVDLGDRKNMAYMGTAVTRGVGEAVVVATGAHTEIGKIASLIKETKEELTPLQKRLQKFSKWLAKAVLSISALLFIIGVVSGRNIEEMFTTSVAVAVSAIPEGLIVAVTVILTIGMRRILKEKGLVKKLVAAEALGSTTVICTDKTGTLTEGIMHVSEIITNNYNLDTTKKKSPDIFKKGQSTLMALHIGMLCNNAFVENEEEDLIQWKVIGNPTERALLVAGNKLGLRKSELEKHYPRLDEIPFDSAKKYMVTLNKKDSQKNYVFMKGAPEKVLAMCSRIDDDGKVIKLTEEKRQQFLKRFEQLSSQGLRLLSFAYKEVSAGIHQFVDFQEWGEKLIFVGFVSIKDPLRPETKQAIKICRKAGLKPIMITGDHKLTAKAIASELGIPAGIHNIMTGEEIMEISDKDLVARVKDITVYARVSPEDKLRIIDAWQARGEVVAMTGDGINDAPALKAADIGVALGSGTDVTKETAELIILDDNFSTIVKAIEQGRVIYDNIKKVILYLLSDSFTEIIIIVGGIILGFPLPLLAAQILWVNIVDDGLPNLALTAEPEEPEIMIESPQRVEKGFLDKEMKVLIGLISFITGIIILGIFYYFWQKTGDIVLARTAAFTALGIDSLLYVFSTRSVRHPIWHKNPFSNKLLVGAVFIGIFLQLAAIYTPFLQKVLRTTSLSWQQWQIIIPLTLVVIFFIELTKYIFIHKRIKVKQE
ncbi:MAG: HAD-IC family P-type ATPase [Patescibacteria group bacterium]